MSAAAKAPLPPHTAKLDPVMEDDGIKQHESVGGWRAPPIQKITGAATPSGYDADAIGARLGRGSNDATVAKVFPGNRTWAGAEAKRGQNAAPWLRKPGGIAW